MIIDVKSIAAKFLPEAMVKRLQPFLNTADAVLQGSDDGARAQRMALIVFIIRVFSAVIAFVSQVLLARWLGTFEYGIFVAVWVALIASASIASVGFPSAVIRLIAEYKQNNEFGLLRGSIRISYLMSASVSGLICVFGAVLLYFSPELVKEYYIAPIFIAFICLPILCFESVMDGQARAFNWTLTAFIPTFILRPLGIILIVGFGILLGYEPSSITAMWAGVISTAFSTSVQFLICASKFSKTVPLHKPQYQLRTWSLIAFPMFLVESFYMMQTSVDILLVSVFIDPENTAVYFAAAKILALVHFVYFAVRAASAHRYTEFYTKGDKAGLREFVQRTVTWTFWPSLFLAIVMVALGKYFLMLFGAEFVEGTYVIAILAFGIVIRSSIGPAESLLVMADSQTVCALVYASAMFVNIALNITLIPIIGLEGAAVATTLALTFESIALHVAAKRRLGVHAFILPQRKAHVEQAT